MAKNVQVIDGAENCSYDCFSISDVFFRVIFPQDGQDIEFIEDLLARHPNGELDALFSEMWASRIRDKTRIGGIHGTLFYEQSHKKKYYPNKRDSDILRP